LLHVGCGSVGLIFVCAAISTVMAPVATTRPNTKFFICVSAFTFASIRFFQSTSFVPEHALRRLRHGPHAFVEEPLNARAGVRLGGVEVALRDGIQVMDAEELPGPSAAITEAGEALERIALHDADLLVNAVRDVD